MRCQRRLRQWVLAGCLLGIGAGAATLVVRGAGRGAAPAMAVPLGTALVHRGDLVTTQRYSGQLSYAPRGTARLGGQGTVTALPHVGQRLIQGGSVAAVNDRPIGVLFGTTPLYRTLRSADTTGAQLAVRSAQADLLAAEATQPPTGSGSLSLARAARAAEAQVNVEAARARLLGAERSLQREAAPQQGPDVALIAADMTALGYGQGFTDRWNPALQAAVRRWQARIGSIPSGDIDPRQVLVLGGVARVGSVQGQLGNAPSAVTISLTSPARVATFRVRGDVPAALARGRRVKLSADGRTVSGRVTDVSREHRSAVVLVAFDQSSTLARVAATRVTMTVTTARRIGVLTVPTQSLLALASGGYALQLPSGRLLAVRTGTVQDGQIEVSGRGVHEGVRVVSVI